MTRKIKRTGVKRNRFTKKGKGGKKKNCTSKCKAGFTKEIQTDKRFKALNRLSSFFGAKKTLDKELNNVLDRKDIQNDKVFKNCVKECEKNKKRVSSF
jgi:ribosomal protein L20A (L18A)